MDRFGSVDDALDFAIEREQEASAFYTDLAGQMGFFLDKFERLVVPWLENLVGVT